MYMRMYMLRFEIRRPVLICDLTTTNTKTTIPSSRRYQKPFPHLPRARTQLQTVFAGLLARHAPSV